MAILSGLALAGPMLADCPAKPYATLPLTRSLVGHYMVPVKIADHAFNLLIDTGSPLTFVTEASAEAMGLERKAAGRNLLSLPTGATTRTLVRAELILANFKSSSLDLPVIAKLGQGEDGLLGNDILGRFDVEFDFPHLTMTLYPQAHCASVPWTENGRIAMVDFHNETGHVVFDVDLDGKHYNAHLDTGAPRAYVELETGLDRYGFDVNDPNQMKRHDGNHPDHPSYSHVFDKLAAGSLTVEKAELLMVSKKVSMVRMTPPWMSFGLSLFQRDRVFLSFSDKKIYFAQPAP